MAGHFYPFPSFQEIFTTLCNCCKNTCCSCYRAYHYIHSSRCRIIVQRFKVSHFVHKNLHRCTVWPQTSSFTWHLKQLSHFSQLFAELWVATDLGVIHADSGCVRQAFKRNKFLTKHLIISNAVSKYHCKNSNCWIGSLKFLQAGITVATNMGFRGHMMCSKLTCLSE